MGLDNGLVPRVRDGRGRNEGTAYYIEHVRTVLLRDGAVAPGSLSERTETRRERAFRRSFPGLADHPDQVAIVIENLEGHASVVTVLLPQVDEPVILRCPDAQSASDLKKRRCLQGADLLIVPEHHAEGEVHLRRVGRGLYRNA